MMKLLTSTATIVFLLCAPALAQPATPPANAPGTMRLELSVKTPATTRVHQLVVLDDKCSRVRDKNLDHEDEIQVCTHTKGPGLVVSVSWRVREGTAEYHISTDSVMARTGANLEVGRPGAVRLTLATK